MVATSSAIRRTADFTIRFTKTTRNAEMRSLLQGFGFIAIEENEEMIKLRFAVDRDSYECPEWFAIDALQPV
jgi:hypothetical protein